MPVMLSSKLLTRFMVLWFWVCIGLDIPAKFMHVSNHGHHFFRGLNINTGDFQLGNNLLGLPY